MTEEEQVSVQMDISKILTSILLHYKQVVVPTSLFFGETNIDRELEIQYDNDTESFIFKLKDENGTGTASN
jgi:hypothetical protein